MFHNWEYLFEEVYKGNAQDFANKRGLDGWELVSIESLPPLRYKLFFKRPVSRASSLT